MKVVCAWCQRAGHVEVLYENEPYNDMISHGICQTHAVAVLAEAGLSMPVAARERREL